MHEMIGGKYHYIPREVDDYMLSPELHSYEYRVSDLNNEDIH